VLLLAVLAAGAVAGAVAWWPGREDEPPAGFTRLVPAPAGAFAASVGVNVHMSYSESAYADPRIARRISEAGIRHVRDGLELGRPDQRARLAELARAGARCTLILGRPGETAVPPLLSDVRAVGDAVEAVEGPNEYDNADAPDWPQKLRAYQRELAAGIERDPRLRRLPLLGPSLIDRSSRGALGDLSPVLDRGNMHPYPGGGAPEANLAEELELELRVSAGKPVMATETGYHNALAADSGQPPVSEGVAADYLPRLYLAYFAAGIVRTFWYELADAYSDPDRNAPDLNFGLLRRDLSPKPAFAALTALNRIVRDEGAGDAGNPRRDEGAREPLVLRVEAGEEVRRVLLRKRDGTYLLALWRDVELDRVPGARDGGPAPLPVRVELAESPDGARMFRPSRSPRPAALGVRDGAFSLELAGDAVLVELTP